MPAEGRIAHQVARLFADLAVLDGVSGEQASGPGAETRFDGVAVPCGILFAGETGPFVGVVAYQDVHIVELALLV